MLKNLFIHIVAAVTGLFIAVWLIPGVEFNGPVEIIILSGAMLGFVNYFIKPVLNLITFPLKIITLGVFTLLINIFLVWVVIDIISPIEIAGLMPLLATTFAVWISTIALSPFLSKK